jgi:hypothetical protein
MLCGLCLYELFLIVDTPVAESRWAQVFDGLVDDSVLKHEEHDQLTEQSGEHDEGKCVAGIHVREFFTMCLCPVSL